MLFTSYEFIGFITVLFILFYAIPKRFQWILLLAGSYIFYYLARPVYVAYIFTTTLVVYLVALKLDQKRAFQEAYLKEHKDELTKEEKKAFKAKEKKSRFHWMLLGLLVGLGILAVIKYTNFTISNINGILSAFGSSATLSFVDIVVPMGISFYTFQAIGYLIDVHRGTIKAQRNFFKFALFVSFFPQLVQGPISRYQDLSETLYKEHKFDSKMFTFGLERILWGFFKKLVIADRMLIGVNALIKDADTYKGAYVFVGMLFYALELYCDFTGGIDITIGVAQCLGVNVTENFMRPFFSKNIKEYWNRWHITMGSWFTDYIFYPITVCGPMLKISKWSRNHLGETIGKRVPIYLSSFVVWFTTGIWHGASWNFIVWGLGNFVVIMISQEFEPLYHRFHNKFHLENNRPYQGFQVIRTVLLMSCLRTFDCYRDVPLTFKMFGTMFTEGNYNVIFDGSLLNIGLKISDFIILFIGVIILFMVSMFQRKESVREQIYRISYPLKVCIWFGLFLMVIIFGIYGIGYDATQFIYNQF
ncbi:MAG: MBOAT family protein [Lachnospiraceae bacterium]|nr:MBOAT family protein [Lachnospiraceae bacterium]